MESKVEELLQEQQTELERISGLTSEEAKEIIFSQVKQELAHEAAQMAKEIENRAKEEADKKARKFYRLRFNAVLQIMLQKQQYQLLTCQMMK